MVGDGCDKYFLVLLKKIAKNFFFFTFMLGVDFEWWIIWLYLNNEMSVQCKDILVYMT